MSVSVTKIVNLPQAASKFLVEDETEDEPMRDFKTIGGVFSDIDYAWLSNGPRLEIINTKTGSKVGAWTFGWVLKDSNTEVVCVDEIQRPHGRLPLLAVGLDCDFSGGMICIFDFVTSKIIRAIHIKDKITTLHVIDAGYDVFTLPGPLRSFDGIIAVGTAGGDVFLVDICRQICDEALTTGGLNEIRDELNPCSLCNITSRELAKIEHHKEFAIRNSDHLAIHLNIVFDKPTKHFTLKGPKGDDRIHVNKDEVTVSALYYCPQLGSLLVGYNFGALQLYNLMSLDLVYTSPVCDEHIPISHFAVQEPADDPRAVCYIWAIYSPDEQYPTCLPLAVMYAFCYQNKEHHDGYGCLYQDFTSAAVQYQMELGVPYGHKRLTKQRGGNCLKLKSVTQGSLNREELHHDSTEDNLSLCVFIWNVWFSKKEKDTFLAIFDLNQWYKEQMPSVPRAQYSATYMLEIFLNELTDAASNNSVPILDVYIDKNSIQQFSGAQRLEEHFYPNAITFGMTCLRERDIIFLHNSGVQKALLAQIESSGPLCLVEPSEIYQEVVGLGLVPLFIDLPVNTPVSTNQQREIILGAALENHLMGWLCKCASEWANGSFLSAGCSLDLLISWAFQRAVTLKNNCDNFCTSLFDYSEARLDNNTNILLNSCTRQLKNLYSLYAFIIKKLAMFISNHELVAEQYKSLETVSVYFEVLQWLLNVGLLPECPLTAYPRSDDLERISAPYPAELLAEFYNHRRALLKASNEENFKCSESALFIDALIERECGGKILQQQWRNDGGNGLYPPPSLQALLRTYLIENVDLSYKHSVIIYVFLDLAMTLDQKKYKPVITHLIKFPAVFKVSPSVIKITQAFWQLDHNDYETSMGLLLDPLISPDDLHPWHHKVVLRALMLQNQHNFALLYLQVRKPVIKDDDDVLTVISLYVANNMLDEAFYFEKYFISQNQGTKFLSHFFNECKKNNKLKKLIYRALESNDENFFLKYLTDTKQATADDLHVYYHLLRAHFIEAFESHERTVPGQIENKGLFGQESAIPREKLVYSLKKLLPDVNRSLLSLCYKEKSKVWQQVSRPTPMSVFVHNLSENIQYKSTIIGAALAKAKQTFNETVSKKIRMETEETPFLRTPTVAVGSKRSSAVIVNPRIIDTDFEAATSPPSAKRLKLSPRLSNSFSAPIPSKLDTPLVKRKTPKMRDGTEERKMITPQSILKVKSLINHTPTRKDGAFEDDFRDFEKIEYTPVASALKKSGLGLSPRKCLAKSPSVRFEGLKSSSSSSLNNTRSTLEKLSPVVNVSSEKMMNSDSNILSSKNTSTEDEVFYSPDTSLEEKEGKQAKIEEAKEPPRVVEELESTNESFRVVDKEVEEKSKSLVFSPRGRRSYKRSLEQITPVRSSPRLSRNTSLTKVSLESSPNKSIEIQEPTAVVKEAALNVSEKETEKPDENKSDESVSESPKSSPVLPKLRPRKSLCRQVLETNTRNRVLSSPLESPRSLRSKKIETPKFTKVEETAEKVVLESTTKFEDGEETHKSSFVKKHNLTMSLVESDADSSQDFSIEYGNATGLKLSDSMLKYLNSSSKSLRSKSVLEESDVKEISYKDTEKNVEESDSETGDEQNQLETDVDKVDDKETSAKPVESEVKQVESTYPEGDEFQELEKDTNPNEDSQAVQDKSVANSTFGESKSLAYSVFESSAEIYSISREPSGIKLSDSVLRCIDNRGFGEQTGDQTQNEDVEVMEVDDDDVEVIVESEVKTEEKTEVLVYENLTNSNLDESERKKSHKEILDGISASNSSKENIETFDGESTNRPIDPEMNVFEITDDLSFNDGLLIEKEVTLEENDLCYGQQNTLENVLEENMVAASSTPLGVFEKNVFNESYASDEESNEEEEDDREDQQGEEKADNEVIEIGSSSEESKSEGKSSGSESLSSDDDQSEQGNRRNIYDSDDDYSSELSAEGNDSENSEESVARDEETGEGCGLFKGDIVFVEEESVQKTADVEQEMEDKVEDPHQNLENEDDGEASKHEEQNDQNMEEEKEEQVEETSEDNKDRNVETVPHEGQDEISEHEEQNDEDVGEKAAENLEENEEEKEDDNVETASLKNQQVDEEVREVEEMKVEKQVEEKVEESNDENLEMVSHEDIGDNNDTEQHAEAIAPEIEQEKSACSEEMDDLNYSVPDEENVESAETTPHEKSREEGEENGRIIRNLETIEEKSEDSEQMKIALPEENVQEESVAEVKTSEETMQLSSHDPLDVIQEPVVQLKRISAERDILDFTHVEKQDKKPRARSSSLSSSTSKKSSGRGRPKKVQQETEDVAIPKRVTRGSVDVLSKLEKTVVAPDPDVLEDLVKTPHPVRVLRSRRVSTEESTTSSPVVTLRKRSSSVDEMPTTKNEPKKEVEGHKPRGRRAASVVQLPKIPEDGVVSPKKSKSVLEGYSKSRRVTRQQAKLLQKMDESQHSLDTLDPIVLLDRSSFDGKPDPEEQKVYETSPSSSTASSNVKVTRRLRSASQTSDTSQRSESLTPVKGVRTRKKSTDEVERSSARKKLHEVIEETEKSEPRTTRSRAKSVSSVNSDDSGTSGIVKLGKRRQRVSSTSTLPEIKEEPQKRTRKNSQK